MPLTPDALDKAHADFDIKKSQARLKLMSWHRTVDASDGLRDQMDATLTAKVNACQSLGICRQLEGNQYMCSMHVHIYLQNLICNKQELLSVSALSLKADSVLLAFHGVPQGLSDKPGDEQIDFVRIFVLVSW